MCRTPVCQLLSAFVEMCQETHVFYQRYVLINNAVDPLERTDMYVAIQGNWCG
jgi:hypothetical protein